MIIGGAATGGAFLSWAACGSSSWGTTGLLLHSPRGRRGPSGGVRRSGEDFCMDSTSETKGLASRPFYPGMLRRRPGVRQAAHHRLIISLIKQRGGEQSLVQRVRIGLTGLAFVFILVLLGAVFSRSP